MKTDWTKMLALAGLGLALAAAGGCATAPRENGVEPEGGVPAEGLGDGAAGGIPDGAPEGGEARESRREPAPEGRKAPRGAAAAAVRRESRGESGASGVRRAGRGRGGEEFEPDAPGGRKQESEESMNTIKNGWMATAAAAVLLAAPQPGQAFTRGERLAAAAAAEEAQARLAAAAPLQGKTVTLLPVQGDEEGYLEARLLDAGIQAGIEMVIADDENDARYRRVLEELRRDGERAGLEAVDAETIDGLSAQVLLEARATKGRQPLRHDRLGHPIGDPGADGTGLAEMEVQLLAYEIQTRRYVWSAILNATERADGPDDPAPPPSEPEVVPWPLNAGVEAKAGEGAEHEAELLATHARGRLAALGYRVDSGADQDDLTLTLEPTCAVSDQTGGWWVYEGTLKASLAVHGGEARLLGETSLASRGARGLGEDQAHRNLADDMDARLAGWLDRTLDPGAIGIEAVKITFRLGEPKGKAWDAKAIDGIRERLAGLDGVRSVRLAEQDEASGRTAFKVVYESARMPAGVWNTLLAAHPEVAECLK